MISGEFTSASHPSPKYRLLGPGIACMVAASLTGTLTAHDSLKEHGAETSGGFQNLPVNGVLSTSRPRRPETAFVASLLTFVPLGRVKNKDQRDGGEGSFGLRPGLGCGCPGHRDALRGAPDIYVLFASASSCINDTSQTACAFKAPATSEWRAISVATRLPVSFNVYSYAVAAGWIAGEGIGGVINAAMQIAVLSGDKFGWAAWLSCRQVLIVCPSCVSTVTGSNIRWSSGRPISRRRSRVNRGTSWLALF